MSLGGSGLSVPTWQGALTGGFAACCASAVSQPFDLYKVRLQIDGELQQGNKQGLQAMWKTLRNIYVDEGVGGFYKGLNASLVRQGIYSTVRFGLFTHLTASVPRTDIRGAKPQHSTFQKIWMSVVSGGIGAIVSSPADLIMVRMQADSNSATPRYRGPLHGILSVARTEGVTVLWRGGGPNVARATIVTASQFVSYGSSKDLLLRSGYFADSIWCHTVASLMAGVVTAVCSCPIDTVKTRIMNQKLQVDGTTVYKGMLDCLWKTVRTEGPLGLYKGFVPLCGKVMPQLLTMFVCYEQANIFVTRARTQWAAQTTIAKQLES